MRRCRTARQSVVALFRELNRSGGGRRPVIGVPEVGAIDVAASPVDVRRRRRQRELGDALHFDSEGAQNGEVKETKQNRRDECTLDDFTDGSATRDPGDEHANERGPGNPPPPIEWYPAQQSHAWFVEALEDQIAEQYPDLLPQDASESDRLPGSPMSPIIDAVGDVSFADANVEDSPAANADVSMNDRSMDDVIV